MTSAPSLCCCVVLLQGCFSVSAQMPVHYTVQEVQGIFNKQNKVGGLAPAEAAAANTALPYAGYCLSQPCRASVAVHPVTRTVTMHMPANTCSAVRQMLLLAGTAAWCAAQRLPLFCQKSQCICLTSLALHCIVNVVTAGSAAWCCAQLLPLCAWA
jgi:hypothetical protein